MKKQYKALILCILFLCILFLFSCQMEDNAGQSNSDVINTPPSPIVLTPRGATQNDGSSPHISPSPEPSTPLEITPEQTELPHTPPPPKPPAPLEITPEQTELPHTSPPPEALAPLARARAYTKVKNWNKAIASYAEVISLAPDSYDIYFELIDVYMQTGEKLEALNLLQTGIQRLGGSEDARSRLLLDKWWDTLLSAADEPKELSNAQKESILEQADLLSCLNCFYFAEELDPIQIMYMYDYFCFKYYDFYYFRYEPGEIQYISDAKIAHINEARKVYPAERIDKENGIVLLPDSSVQKLVSDILGLTQYNLKTFYSALRKKYPGALYQKIVEEDSRYEKYMNREDVYCYFSWDPEMPFYEIKRCVYLGNDIYYVVLNETWWDDEETPITFESLHLVLKKTDSFFGFQALAILHDDDGSIIKPYWKLPG